MEYEADQRLNKGGYNIIIHLHKCRRENEGGKRDREREMGREGEGWYDGAGGLVIHIHVNCICDQL